MHLDLRYLGKSEIAPAGDGLSMRLSPNLARPKVFFDGEVQNPIRFREAISALHDVVVSDLRAPKKDRTAYRAFLAEQAKKEAELRARIAKQATTAELAKGKRPAPPNLDEDFRKMHGLYWRARTRWASELMRDDPALFRHLVPCDPVVTVASDVVFFECFSKDESSYACLSVDRGAFSGAGDAGQGTTNVDYSLALYDHFQTLRTYRPTRLLVDPTGFDVKVHGREDYREEKIDLPPTWLRGFGQLQAAMALPARRVELSVDVLYSLLAFLARRVEKTGPRSLRFVLEPGQPPVIELEPWGVRIESRGPAYDPDAYEAVTGGSPYRAGARRSEPERIQVWGRRRLFVLARLLPLVTRLEVRLLGSGLPSIWIAHCGDMRLVLALSGWTANDWAGGANVDLIAGDLTDDPRTSALVARHLAEARTATLGELAAKTGAPREALLGALHGLAKQGQLIYDFATEAYRARPVMPFALAEAVLGPEPAEAAQGKQLAADKAVRVASAQALAGGRVLVQAKVKDTSCEAIFDDAGIGRAKCTCSFFYKNRMRKGPCRHLLALRLTWFGRVNELAPAPDASPPLAASAAAPEKQDVFTFRKELAEALEARCQEEQRSLPALLEEAWDLGMPRIQACKAWADAVALAPGAGEALGGGFVKPPIASRLTGLHASVIAEIGKVAKQLGVSPSVVLNLAVMLQRKGVKR
jgi:hypothetical protein